MRLISGKIGTGDAHDVYATTTRGEGFGLPIAESLLHETPVIVHDKGGHTDFVDPENNFIVKTFKTPAYCTYAPRVYTCESNWYDTDLISARKKMRECYNLWKNSKQELVNRGSNSKKYMLDVTGDASGLGKRIFDFILAD